MSPWIRGLLSGAAATALLSLLLWLTAWSGLVPEMDLVGMLARVLGESRGVGLLVFLAVGIPGYGLALALLLDEGDSPLATALWLSAVGWFATMMALLPMAGFTPFGIGSGVGKLLVCATWYVAFGVALGGTWILLPLLQSRALAPLLARVRPMTGRTA